MNRILDHLVAGLIAAVVTGAVAGLVIWKITATQHDFVARQFAAQNAKIQALGDELARTAGAFKRLDGALKTTEATLREVKDRVSLVGTRTGIAHINTLVEAANKTLDDIKHATAPAQAKTALTPLGEKLDTANKTLSGLTPLGEKIEAANKMLAALAPLGDKLEAVRRALASLQTKLDDKSGDKTRDEALTRIETTIADVKAAITKQASAPALTQANIKLDDALKSLTAIGKATDALKGNGTDAARFDDAAKSIAAIKASIDAIRSRADAEAAKLDDAAKSIAALDASVRQGFTELTSKQTEVTKAAAKPAPAPAQQQPVKPRQDLVVFYVSMAGNAAAAPTPTTTAALGLTPPAPAPLAVRYEQIGGVDDEGQAKLIAGKLRGIIKGHSGCTIAVAGHADTLGSDRDNYELSKERATAIAGKLKTAFAGSGVAVSQTQWGERHLKEWTPDGTAREANRRVDIKVSCKK